MNHQSISIVAASSMSMYAKQIMNPILNVQSIQAVLMNYHLLANMIHHLLLILMSDDENTYDLSSLKDSDDELDVDSRHI